MTIVKYQPFSAAITDPVAAPNSARAITYPPIVPMKGLVECTCSASNKAAMAPRANQNCVRWNLSDARLLKPGTTCVQLLGRNDYNCKGVIMT